MAKEKLRIARKIWQGELPIDEAKRLFRQHQLRYAVVTIYEHHATKPKHEPEDCPFVPERFNLSRYGRVVFQVGEDAVLRLDW
jgi:hypothetical protein